MYASLPLKSYQSAAGVRQYFKDHHKFLKVFKKLDNEGKVILVKDEDLKVRFHGAGTKGGQHANHNNTLAYVTHIPTGIKALGDISRSQPDNLKFAISKMRMLLDIKLRGDDSIFTKLELERQKLSKTKKNLQYQERRDHRKNENKLKHLLNQPDLVNY